MALDSVGSTASSKLPTSRSLMSSLLIVPTHFPNKTPATKEAYWYRCMFNDLFGDRLDLADTVELWVPRGDWGCPSDPSGRAQAVHTDYKPDTME
ncbi:hypothetical protein BASA81_002862 [Batrachochytrium salamandrivorans]|nr:hypothetical protein BASA81_002862 [Batrachochytrium salamandrivorans]